RDIRGEFRIQRAIGIQSCYPYPGDIIHLAKGSPDEDLPIPKQANAEHSARDVRLEGFIQGPIRIQSGEFESLDSPCSCHVSRNENFPVVLDRDALRLGPGHRESGVERAIRQQSREIANVTASD